MCFIHKWSKWEHYDSHRVNVPIYTSSVRQEKGIAYIVKRQKRHCLKCNEMQDKPVQVED